MKVSDTNLCLIQPHILPIPSFLWEKSEPSFFEHFENSTLHPSPLLSPPPYKVGRGGSKYE